jgi:hypothetical protein
MHRCGVFNSGTGEPRVQEAIKLISTILGYIIFGSLLPGRRAGKYQNSIIIIEYLCILKFEK